MRAALLLAVALTGCGKAKEDAFLALPGYDQCLRAELFQKCMTALPAGPASTKYNDDWGDVIIECQRSASYMSVRRVEAIKPECLAS